METTNKKDAPEPKVVTDPEVAVAEEAPALKEKKAKDAEDKEEETAVTSRSEKAKRVSSATKVSADATRARLVKMLTLWIAKTELAVAREAKTDKVVAVDNGVPLRMM